MHYLCGLNSKLRAVGLGPPSYFILYLYQPKKELKYERNYSCRWQCHSSLSVVQGYLQADNARLRQADDILPALYTDVGGNSRSAYYLYSTSFSYKIQENPNGLAQAFVLGAEFLDGGPGCLILGDNMFYGQGFSAMLKRAASIDKGACIFGYYVKDPRAYGVVEFDANGKAVSLEEKPANPKSNYAVPGLYFYDSTVTEKAASLKPSARGEYEITDLNRLYLDEGTLKVELFGRGFAWLDTGNCDSLLEASNFVATIQNRQGFRVSCIEEIAWRKGWIDVDQLYRLGEQLGKTEYGKYLMELAESKR